MDIISKLVKCAKENPQRIVLPEGTEERTMRAADRAIADGMAALMAPLARLGVPVGGLSMAVSVALRFIPLASEEVERIRCAQRARGARLDEGGVIRRLSGWGQVLVPLVVSLFRRADELAAAMEDRCFTGEQTSMRGRLSYGDVAVLLGVVAWSACALLA